MSKKSGVKKNVESLLRLYPETRNDDKLLTIMYWKMYDKVDMSNEESFYSSFMHQSTSTESIRRARQLIQEDGYYTPTDEDVVVKRRCKQVRMKKAVKMREVV